MSAGTEALATFWLGLVNHLWQTTLVLGVLVVLDRLLRRAPAALRADLWTLGLAKLLIPAALGGAVVAAVSARFVGTAPAVGTVVASVLAPVPESAGSLAPWWGVLLIAVTMVWLVGVGVAGGRLARDLGRQGGLARGAHPVTETPLRQAADRAGVPRDRILVAPQVSLPLVQGWWSPRILVPAHLVRVLAPAELEALLRHEDRHRRRRDPLRLLLGRVAAVAFWFYPPLRWLLARLHECSEYACDDAALADGTRTEDYLRALARAIRRGLDPAPPVAAAASGGPHLLRRRLARLRRKERPTMKLGRLILAAAVLLVGAAIFVPLDLVAEDTPPPPPPAKAKEPAPPPPPAKAGKEELVEPPRMIKLVEPAYPEKAKQARIEGTVKLAAVVDASGTVIKVVKVQEIDGHPEFTKAAVEALQMCEFEPGTVDGEATTMKTIVTMKFELD